MNNQRKRDRSKSGRGGCDRVRLAQRPGFAVDACDGCDTLQVHLGGVTMRLSEASVHELHLTLQEALTVRAERAMGAKGDFTSLSWSGPTRGEA